MVESVCGGSPRAQDVTDRFGVYGKLGWMIWNVVYGEDALGAMRHLPNPRSLKVWNEAAAKAGVDAQAIRKLDDAIASLQRSSARHAENRTMLDMLVDSRDETRDEATDAKWRKQMFQGCAYTWGIRAKTLLSCALFFPSRRRPDQLSVIRVRALLGLVRHRANVRWPLSQMRIDKDAFELGNLPCQPLLGGADPRAVPLLDDFCTRPLPAVERKLTRPELLEDELLPGEVGQQGAADVVTGEVVSEIGSYLADDKGDTLALGTSVRTPSEVLISDQLVHRDLFPGRCKLEVYGELISPLSRDPRDLIPIAAEVQRPGTARENLGTAEFPRYRELLKLAISKSGYPAEEFDVYRVRVPYPPMPASVVLRYDQYKPGEQPRR